MADAVEVQTQKLNVTYGGRNGEVEVPGLFDLNDDQIRQTAVELIRGGDIETVIDPGIADNAFRDFVVERYGETATAFVRPKTPFGA